MAGSAEKFNNPLKFFQVINALAPRRSSERVHNRDEAGRVSLRQRKPKRSLCIGQVSTRAPGLSRVDGRYSSQRTLPKVSYCKLSELKVKKAVLLGVAPAGVWKVLAPEMAEYLSSLFEKEW